MIITGPSGAVDLSRYGIQELPESVTARSASTGLLDGGWSSVALGIGPRTWDLTWEMAIGAEAERAWTAIQGWAKNREILTLRRHPDAQRNAPTDVANGHLTGRPRREWVAILGGIPQIYRYSIRVEETVPPMPASDADDPAEP